MAGYAVSGFRTRTARVRYAQPVESFPLFVLRVVAVGAVVMAFAWQLANARGLPRIARVLAPVAQRLVASSPEEAARTPVFLAQALDDPVAPVDNSLLMFAALRRAQVPVALHLFQRGGHGWGLGKAGSEPAAWPLLLQAWLKAGSY